MKRALLASALLSVLAVPAEAQQAVQIFTGASPAQPVSGSNPLAVNATVTATATTTATAAATPPAVSAGTGKPLVINLFSALFTQPTYGDGVPVDLTHGFPVNVVAGAAGGTALADEATFTAGTTPFTPAGGFFQTTNTSNPLTNGQGGWAQMTATRSLMMNLRNNAGAETGVAAVPFQVSLANTGANTNKLLVTPDSIALPANQSVNVAQVNGTTTLVNTGAVGTGAQRVAVGADTATIAGSAPGTAGSASTNVVTVQGIASGTTLPTQQSSQYPVGTVAETASATGTIGATTATLATNTGQTTSICGFSIRANATAAATNNATVTGTITGTLNFTQWTAPLASGLGVTEMIFTPCIPASTTNTSIAVISGAPGSGGVVSVSAWGFLK